MNNTEAIAFLNGFTAAQKAEFNTRCSNKIYTEETGTISLSDLNDAIAVADHIGLMKDAEVQDINSSLNSNNKLSGRPC